MRALSVALRNVCVSSWSTRISLSLASIPASSWNVALNMPSAGTVIGMTVFVATKLFFFSCPVYNKYGRHASILSAGSKFTIFFSLSSDLNFSIFPSIPEMSLTGKGILSVDHPCVNVRA